MHVYRVYTVYMLLVDTEGAWMPRDATPCDKTITVVFVVAMQYYDMIICVNTDYHMTVAA